ncbi:flagellar export protein FliJ [Hydrogenovibrio kuenenii]|uniref:flagellar export protein FliJ n=1 Tax=Hydrogenovibrio kuenenii TaxID=63658 RepID=UPI0004633690|nr:flagellar export protein FliJ [Hydrogenovibrio kuenenii]
MLKRLERMKKLVELAQDDLEKASMLLRSIQQQISMHQEQIDSLQSYQSDYIQQLSSKESTTLQQLNTKQAFLNKLNVAIDQQTEEVVRLNHVANEAEQSWIEFKSREQSLVKLYEKIQKNHNTKMDKVEQKMLDDLSGRQFFFSNQSDD